MNLVEKFYLTSNQRNANLKKISPIKLLIKRIKIVSVSKGGVTLEFVKIHGRVRIGTNFLEIIMSQEPRNVDTL